MNRPGRPGLGVGGGGRRRSGGGGLFDTLFGSTSPYAHVGVNPLFTQEGQDFAGAAADEGVPFSTDEMGQPFTDTRSKLFGFGPRLGHNNAADINALYGANQVFGAQDAAQRLNEAQAMLPIKENEALIGAYGPQGLRVTPENIKFATNAINAKRALEEQQNRQAAETGRAIYPLTRSTAISQAEKARAEAGVGAKFASTSRAREAMELGAVGQYVTPAAQAARLATTELPANAVAYDPLAKLFSSSFSPFMQGPKLTTEDQPEYYNIGGKQYPTGHTIHRTNVQMPLGPISDAEVEAIRSKLNTHQRSGEQAPAMSIPDDRGDSTPLLNPSAYGQPSTYRQPGLFSSIEGAFTPTDEAQAEMNRNANYPPRVKNVAREDLARQIKSKTSGTREAVYPNPRLSKDYDVGNIESISPEDFAKLPDKVKKMIAAYLQQTQ